jgi:hypothetical protein
MKRRHPADDYRLGTGTCEDETGRGGLNATVDRAERATLFRRAGMWQHSLQRRKKLRKNLAGGPEGMGKDTKWLMVMPVLILMN